MLSTALNVVTTTGPEVRGYLYAAGRLCGTISRFELVRNRIHFIVNPGLAFHGQTHALSHVAMIYRGTITVAPILSGYARDGVATYGLDHVMTLPSPECPGLRLPSLVRV